METELLIFISHDTRDAEIAEAFSDVIKKSSLGLLKSFRSSDRKGKQGIEYGHDWYPVIMDHLNKSTAVVCLLTKNSLNRPWILYEAGVAKGKLDKRVLGISIGIPLSEVAVGPFAQFQNCDDNVETLTTLVMQLLNNIPGIEPEREFIIQHVREFKDRINKILQLKNETKESEKEISSNDEVRIISDKVAQMLEEMKLIFQSQISNGADLRTFPKSPFSSEYPRGAIVDYSQKLDGKTSDNEKLYRQIRSEFLRLLDNSELNENRIDLESIIDQGHVKLPHGFSGMSEYRRNDNSLICQLAFLGGAANGYARYFDENENLVGEAYYIDGRVVQTRIYRKTKTNANKS